MELTKNELNNICKTLPIGYYIGRKLNVEVDDSIDGSYFDPMKDEIKISVKQLNKAINDINCEEDVRCMLYHEVSHAFLTPKKMNINWQRNVVEDERIETILADYYLNTNFKEFVKKVNHFKGEAPDNLNSAFYQLVRYRIGEKKWLDRLNDLLVQFKEKTRNSSSWDYEDAIDNFYNDFMYEKLHEQQEEQESNKQQEVDVESNKQQEVDVESNKQQEVDVESNKDQSEEQNEEQNQEIECENNSACSNEPENENDDQHAFNKEFAKELVKQIVDEYENQNFDEKINEILSKINFRTKTNGTAICGYSGTFDYRQVVREDYKYFIQKNRNGHVKSTSKFHLNLFIDKSGSFHESEQIVNSMLKTLTKFERQNHDFDFDLITCGEGQKIKKKSERFLKCGSGNHLTSNIFDQFKSVQKSDAITYNIVLFDGDALSFGPSCDRVNFKAFNKPNVTIISDSDNECAINTYCKQAKKIICKNYTEELIDNIIKTLRIMAR